MCGENETGAHRELYVQKVVTEAEHGTGAGPRNCGTRACAAGVIPGVAVAITCTAALRPTMHTIRAAQRVIPLNRPLIRHLR